MSALKTNGKLIMFRENMKNDFYFCRQVGRLTSVFYFKHTAVRFFPLKEDCRIKVRNKALVFSFFVFKTVSK